MPVESVCSKTIFKISSHQNVFEHNSKVTFHIFHHYFLSLRPIKFPTDYSIPTQKTKTFSASLLPRSSPSWFRSQWQPTIASLFQNDFLFLVHFVYSSSVLFAFLKTNLFSFFVFLALLHWSCGLLWALHPGWKMICLFQDADTPPHQYNSSLLLFCAAKTKPIAMRPFVEGIGLSNEVVLQSESIVSSGIHLKILQNHKTRFKHLRVATSIVGHSYPVWAYLDLSLPLLVI